MKFKILAATAVGLLLGSAAIAVTVPDMIKARQANFKVMGRANKGLNDEMKKPEPSLAVVRSNALALETAARRVAGMFPKGSGAESEEKTTALPTIWAKPRDFKVANDKLVAAARAVQLAAATGNMERVKAAVSGVGPTCKGCHDGFRGKD